MLYTYKTLFVTRIVSFTFPINEAIKRLVVSNSALYLRYKNFKLVFIL